MKIMKMFKKYEKGSSAAGAGEPTEGSTAATFAEAACCCSSATGAEEPAKGSTAALFAEVACCCCCSMAASAKPLRDADPNRRSHFETLLKLRKTWYSRVGSTGLSINWPRFLDVLDFPDFSSQDSGRFSSKNYPSGASRDYGT